jgi:hypothetical protein
MQEPLDANDIGDLQHVLDFLRAPDMPAQAYEESIGDEPHLRLIGLIARNQRSTCYLYREPIDISVGSTTCA